MTQRVIKFRCWDVYNDRMVYEPDRFEPAYTEDEKLLAPWVFYETWEDREDGIRRPCHVMQFTGLLDKHGKEIYEGDIRKEMFDGIFNGDYQREHYFVMVYIQEWTMFAWLSITSGEYEEYLKDGAEALDTEMYWTYPAGQDELNNVELVGNIYTTPELVDPKMIER